MMGQAKFTYSALAKSLEKQIKTIVDWGEKQTKKIIKLLNKLKIFSVNQMTNLIKDRLKEIIEVKNLLK